MRNKDDPAKKIGGRIKGLRNDSSLTQKLLAGLTGLSPDISPESKTSSVIMFIVVFAGLFTWAASVIGVIDKAANFVISISPSAIIMIILINLLLLGLGIF